METAETTAIILLIVAGASTFGYLITTRKITDNIADVVLSITTQPWLILLLVTIFLHSWKKEEVVIPGKRSATRNPGFSGHSGFRLPA